MLVVSKQDGGKLSMEIGFDVGGRRKEFYGAVKEPLSVLISLE